MCYFKNKNVLIGIRFEKNRWTRIKVVNFMQSWKLYGFYFDDSDIYGEYYECELYDIMKYKNIQYRKDYKLRIILIYGDEI